MFFVINTDFSAVKTERNAGRRRPADSDVAGASPQTRSDHMKHPKVLLDGVRDGRGAGADDAGADAGTHQGRHPALAFGHDGHQRDDAERHRADDDCRAEQERRAARPKARSGGRRSRIELAALRRKGVAAADAGQSGRRLRLLDVGVEKIGAAGLREEQRPPLLSRSVRRRGVVEECHLHRGRAESAGDSRRRLSDERHRREAVGARRAPTTSIRARPTAFWKRT